MVTETEMAIGEAFKNLLLFTLIAIVVVVARWK